MTTIILFCIYGIGGQLEEQGMKSMLAATSRAAVEDDLYGEDPTVNNLDYFGLESV